MPVTEPMIRVKTGSDIGLSKSVLRALGCPAHIHFWWSENEKAILVSTSDNETNLSIPVHEDYYKFLNGWRTSNKKLLRAINFLTGWEQDSVHKFSGELIPELKMFAFRTCGGCREVSLREQ